MTERIPLSSIHELLITPKPGMNAGYWAAVEIVNIETGVPELYDLGRFDCRDEIPMRALGWLQDMGARWDKAIFECGVLSMEAS